MAIDVYVKFNGNCREAVSFYTQAFKTEEAKFLTFADSAPKHTSSLSEEAKHLIMYTKLNISGSDILFSDIFPGTIFVAGNNISLTIKSKNTEDITAYFNALKEDGKIHMELQETFWSKCYGSLTDKFGIGWQFNHDSSENER